MENEIMRKVAKLLRLAQSDNANEAAQAAARAQELIDRYKLGAVDMDFDLKESAGDMPEEPVQEYEDPLYAGQGRKAETWRGRLALTLAQANQCVVHYRWRNGKKDLAIIGRPSDAMTVRYLFAYLANEVERLAHLKRGNGRTWINNYKNGVVEGIAGQIKLEKSRLRDKLRAEAGSSTALVKLNTGLQKMETRLAEAEGFYTKKTGRRGAYTHRSSEAARFDAGARALGRQDGAKVRVGGGGRSLNAPASKQLK